MDFCVRYHVLATPLVTLSFAEREQSGFWTIDPILHHTIDERLYRFIVELQIGVHLSLERDLMGQSFRPREINLAYPPARDFRLTEDLVGCTLRFEQPANVIIFDAKWLDQPANLGNRTTYKASSPCATNCSTTSHIAAASQARCARHFSSISQTGRH